MGHIGIAHLLKGVGGEGGSSTRSAVQNHAPIGIELGPVISTCRVSPELEHSPRSVHRPRDRPLLYPLTRLSKIDKECIALIDLFCRLVNRQILDALLGLAHQFSGGLRHYCLHFIASDRSPTSNVKRSWPHDTSDYLARSPHHPGRDRNSWASSWSRSRDEASPAAIIKDMPGTLTPATPIRSLLIANRGEIAVRVIRAAREVGIRSVAVYGEGEQDAMHVRLADEAWRIPSGAPIPYLDIPAIIELARSAGVDAVHPGYGFLAENAAFARACADAGVVFVGPPAAAIAAMGDKIEARRIAAAAGVPVVPGSDGPVASPSEALAWGAESGYPVAVKASGGGGGRGFRVARGPEEMEEAFLGAAGEAARSFANPLVYLERYLDNPRHIEVQIMADAHGQIVAVGDRDCSVQRRHQKLLEEAPAPGISDDIRGAMAAAAISLARVVDYRGAGTVEFLLDSSGPFAFLEMNTRIQVEHPVTEMTTGIDLVREQLLVASGAPLSFAVEDIAPRGHAIECRINAEDPGNGFAPAPGAIRRYRAPAGMGVRVDSAVESGTRIHPAYDSLIAKIITWGRDRGEAAARMRRALVELEVDGVPTTREFHLRLLEHPAWTNGTASTTFLDRHPEVIPPPTGFSSVPELHGDRPVELVAEVNGHRFEIRLHDGSGRVSATHSASRRPEPAAKPDTGRSGDGALLRSPIQGTVVRVAVEAGEHVTRGQTVCVVEAMKMENDVTAHRDGVLTRLTAAPGTPVRVGDTIAEIA